jgi:hypothetical protein
MKDILKTLFSVLIGYILIQWIYEQRDTLHFIRV